MKITDPGELADRQRVKRKGFEDDIRKNRTKMTNWIKYAAWEENQREYDRARYTFLEPSRRTVSMIMCVGLCTRERSMWTIATLQSGSSTPRWR